MDIKEPSEATLEELGILTKDKIRKYPLTLLNLNRLIKIYAMETNQSYIFEKRKGRTSKSKWYITDKGLEMFYTFCETTNPILIRRSLDLMKYDESDFRNIRNMNGMFVQFMRGDKGYKTTSREAIIKLHVGKATREHKYETVEEARNIIKTLLAYYTPKQIELFAVRHTEKKGSWLVKLPTIKQPRSPVNKEGQFDKHRTI